MNKKEAIYEYLSRHHIGEQNAVCSKELQRLISLDGRDLRRKINSLRQDGVAICSGPMGYYYAASQKEINKTVCRLNGLVTTISNARTGLLYASVRSDRELSVKIQIELNGRA